MSENNAITGEHVVSDKFPEKFEYNPDLLRQFIQMIFGDELDPDENILAWRTQGSNIPGYPKSIDEVLHAVSRSPVASSLYFSTATVRSAPDGKLYNRQQQFHGLYVVVLDDVGTKVKLEDIPKSFKPTYIVESSPGNFQYGYVLAEPIFDLTFAKALVQLVYTSKLTDSGGNMPNKLVRLPDGINGKKGDKGKFHVKLHSMDGPLYTPEEILAVVEPDLTVDDIKAESAKLQQRLHRDSGGSKWVRGDKLYMTPEGIIDPVLELLARNGDLIDDTVRNGFVTIRCPWAEEHSDGKDWAGYSPLGAGEGRFKHRRGFHCFHDSHADKRIEDFLYFIYANGGELYPVEEPCYDMLTRYAYDAHNDGIWELRGVPYPRFYSSKVIPNVHTDKLTIVTDTGKLKQHGEMQHFIRNVPNKIIVQGKRFDPTTADPITSDAFGNHYLNTFKQPLWGDGDYDDEKIKFFLEYIKYLIPNDDDREYFMNWLACKAQNMGFRGQAIIMVAITQGMGRTTLGKMVGAIFGDDNLCNMPFDKLTGDNTYNDGFAHPFVVTDETLAVAKDDSIFKVYERLKDLVDTTPKKVTFNPKYGKQYTDMTYTSFMMFSNHANALMMSGKDRRFYVLKNADTPASPEYFQMVNDKLSEVSPTDTDCWAAHVWRWLRKRPVSPADMVQQQEPTLAKEEMLMLSKSPLEVAVMQALHHWSLPVITLRDIKEVIKPLLGAVAPDTNASVRNRVISQVFKEHAVAVLPGKKFKVDGSTTRINTFQDVLTGSDRELVDALLVEGSPKLTNEIMPDYRDARPAEIEAVVVKVREDLEYYDKI